MIDFIIVGNGLAGISFAEIALQNNKSIFVFDNNKKQKLYKLKNINIWKRKQLY